MTCIFKKNLHTKSLLEEDSFFAFEESDHGKTARGSANKQHLFMTYNATRFKPRHTSNKQRHTAFFLTLQVTMTQFLGICRI